MNTSHYVPGHRYVFVGFDMTSKTPGLHPCFAALNNINMFVVHCEEDGAFRVVQKSQNSECSVGCYIERNVLQTWDKFAGQPKIVTRWELPVMVDLTLLLTELLSDMEENWTLQGSPPEAILIQELKRLLEQEFRLKIVDIPDSTPEDAMEFRSI